MAGYPDDATFKMLKNCRIKIFDWFLKNHFPFNLITTSKSQDEI